MVPSLLPGDRIFVDKRFNRPGAGEVRHGDIAIFVYPNNRTQVYVKRVIGLPGDDVEITDAGVSINGHSLTRDASVGPDAGVSADLLKDHVASREAGDEGSYLVLWKKDEKRVPFKLHVPNGQVFVLGDNRDGSHDSRIFGTLPLVDIIAKVRQVWFSRDEQTGVRWGRLGKVVE